MAPIFEPWYLEEFKGRGPEFENTNFRWWLMGFNGWLWLIGLVIVFNVLGKIIGFLSSTPVQVFLGICFLLSIISAIRSSSDSQSPAKSKPSAGCMPPQELAELEEALEAARAAAQERERLRIQHRDSDVQETPYLYKCVGHPNKTLALRYGVVNRVKQSGRRKPGWMDGDTIRIRKKGKLKLDIYLAELPDFADREVKVVIESGTENVKTFYPWSEDWFQKHADLELVLKDNKAFTLKELANFHIQKTVKGV